MLGSAKCCPSFVEMQAGLVGPPHSKQRIRPTNSYQVCADRQLQISPMAVQRAQKKALAALRQQLVGAG